MKITVSKENRVSLRRFDKHARVLSSRSSIGRIRSVISQKLAY